MERLRVNEPPGSFPFDPLPGRRHFPIVLVSYFRPASAAHFQHYHAYPANGVTARSIWLSPTTAVLFALDLSRQGAHDRPVRG